MPITDLFSRPLRDLRISVTDRCNFRCTYCMPREVFGADFAFLPKSEVLSFEEITRLAGIFIGLGVEKLRITGGEPLLRRGLDQLVGMLARLGPADLTLTTNGSLLSQQAAGLFAAGLRRLTVSLDSLDDNIFSAMNAVEFPVQKVLDGIEIAQAVGFTPVKINMMVKKGLNDQDIVPMAERFRGPRTILRLIEYMDVGNCNQWRVDEVFSAAEMVKRIGEVFPLAAVPPAYPGEVAMRYRYLDGQGEIGIIGSITQPFCQGCTRARLSSDGKLFTCLFASEGLDLRDFLREGRSDAEISALIEDKWHRRDDRYSELRAVQTHSRPRVEMSQIGG